MLKEERSHRTRHRPVRRGALRGKLSEYFASVMVETTRSARAGRTVVTNACPRTRRLQARREPSGESPDHKMNEPLQMFSTLARGRLRSAAPPSSRGTAA
jgi:hypothetical protein